MRIHTAEDPILRTRCTEVENAALLLSQTRQPKQCMRLADAVSPLLKSGSIRGSASSMSGELPLSKDSSFRQ